MQLDKDIEQVRQSLMKADKIQEELDRRVFHLKTLYDVSKDIYSSTDTKTILRSFLLMSIRATSAPWKRSSPWSICPRKLRNT